MSVLTGAQAALAETVHEINMDALTWQMNRQSMASHTPKQVKDKLTDEVRFVTLADKASNAKVKAENGGVRFSVEGPIAQRVAATWLAHLTPIVCKSGDFVQLRYKTQGVHRRTTREAIVELLGADGQSVLEVFTDEQIFNDGLWHTVVVKFTKPCTITTLRVDLGTTASQASMMLEDLRISSQLQEAWLAESAGLESSPPETDSSWVQIDLDHQFNASLKTWHKAQLSNNPIGVDVVGTLHNPMSTMHGVPFAVSGEGNNYIRPAKKRSALAKKVEYLGQKVPRQYFGPPSRDDTISVEVGQHTSEIFMLLVAQYQSVINNYAQPKSPFNVSDVEAFAVELVYSDNTTTWAFPYSLADDGYVIQRPLSAYGVKTDANKLLKRVVLHNRNFSFDVGLAGLSINTGTSTIVPDYPEVKTTTNISPPASQTYKPTRPHIRKEPGKVVMGNQYFSMTISTENGWRIREISQKHSQDANAKISIDSFAGFALKIDGQTIDSRKFNVRSATIDRNIVTFILDGSDAARDVEVQLRIEISSQPNIDFEWSIINHRSTAIQPQLLCPLISGLTIGTLEDTWYMFPRYSMVNSNEQASYLQSNDYGFPMQFYTVYNPHGEVGMTIMTQNLQGRPIDYGLAKTRNGVQALVRYPETFHHIDVAQKLVLPRTQIIIHTGDWKQGLRNYKAWVDRWYKPQHANNREWFDQAFLARTVIPSQVQSKAVNKVPSIFDADNGIFRAAEVISAATAYRGVQPDLVHFFNWSYQDPDKKQWYGGYNEPEAFQNIGGKDALVDVVGDIQNDIGIPVSLYTIADRVSASSQWGKKYGVKASVTHPKIGSDPNANVWYVNVNNEEWRNHIVRDMVKLVRDTGAKALYIDVFGFRRPLDGRTSHIDFSDPQHPSWPTSDTLKFMKQLRQELPGTVIWSEYMLPDVAAQYTDGNIDYSFQNLSEHASPIYPLIEKTPLASEPLTGLHRYAFPKIKQFAFAVGMDHERSASRMKMLFFNGLGHYDVAYRLHNSRIQNMLNKTIRLQKEFADCFSSNTSEPRVATLQSHVYSNKFPGKNKTIWTLYNGRYATAQGEILMLPHEDGMSYYDAWNGQTLSPEIRNQHAVIKLSLDPQGLGAVVQQKSPQ